MRWLTILFVLCASGARSAEPSQDDELRAALDRARVCWAALDPECAEGALMKVRAGLHQLDPLARVEALRMSAEVALSTERAADAHQHLLALLALDPRFSPSGWPGPWMAALHTARDEAPDRLPPELTVDLPAEARPRTAVTIEVRADDPSGIARCELVLADGVRVALLSADGLLFRGDIPKAEVRAPGVRLHIEASDRAGNVATWPAAGSHHLLVSAPVEPESTSILQRWWFWTAVGAVALGGAIGLVLALDDGTGGGPELVREGELHVVWELP